MLSVGALLLSYVCAGGVLYLALARFLRVQPRERVQVALLCAGLGPIAISRVVTAYYRLLPGLGDLAYIALCGSVFVPLAVYGVRGKPAAVERWPTLRVPEPAVVALPALMLVLGVGLAVALTQVSGLQVSVMSAYGAYAARWNPAGAWWQASVTDWGAAVLVLAALCGLAVRRRGAAGTSAGTPTPFVRGAILVVLGAACVAIVAGAFILAVGRPVYENDAVQYFKVATLLYEKRSVAFYPLMPAVPNDGTWAVSAHPLGYYGMLMWSFLISGSAAPGVAKLIAPLHGTLAAVAIAVLARRFGLASALAAALVWLSTPAVFVQTVGLGIDMPRLLVLLVALIWLVEASRNGSSRGFVAAGAALGLCVYCHALNLIAGALVMIAVFAVTPMTWRTRTVGGAVTSMMALAVGGEQYVLNWLRLGSPIYDWQPLWDLVPSLGYIEWRVAMLATNDFWSRLAAGPLIGFSRWYEWGFAWWAGVAGIMVAGRELWAHSVVRAGLASLAFFLLALLAYYGFHPQGGRYVLNYRYPMTVYPFVALAAGVWLGRLLDPSAPRG